MEEEKMKGTNYRVFWIAGENDGVTLGEFGTESEAIAFAREQTEAHKDEFDPCCGGIGIVSADGEVVIDW